MLRSLPALAALALLTAGCGYIGDPLPPLANVPAAVQDLSAFQRSARIVVEFTLPAKTTEDLLIKSPLQVDLRAGTAQVEPFSAEAWAAQAKPVPPGPVENGRARIEIPTGELTGKQVTIGVRVIGSNGKASDWSNFVNLPVVPPPAAPASLEAKATAGGVLLSWQGDPGDFRIFRRAGKEPDFSPIGETRENRWTDPKSQFGTFYSYVVQRIVKLPNGREAESEMSNAVSLSPADTFAPAAPSGLRAITGTGSIELSWDRVTESDVAGYRVYRAAPGGSWERIGDAPLPGYSDRGAEQGKAWRYAVTAVDRAGNESAQSAEVTAVLPQ